MRIGKVLLLTALVVLGFTISAKKIYAQAPQQMNNQNSQVGLILYPIERGANGQQYITTRAGYKVAIPGLGIAPNATQLSVYKDAENNFWYIDKNNQPTAVSPQQMQQAMSQIQGQVEYRDSMQQPQQLQAAQPQSANQNSQQNANQSNNNKSSSGSSAMVTGLAAAGGAAVGSILTNSIYDNNQYPNYNGVPYGAAMYRENDGRYYYNNPDGKHVYVAPNNNTSSMFHQYEQQGNWKDRDQWAQTQATQATQNAAQNQSDKLSKSEQRRQAKEAQVQRQGNINDQGGRRGLRRGGRFMNR